MFKNILESVSGIEIYAIAGLLIFLVMFVAILFWIFRIDKKYIEKMEQLPLENNFNENFNLTGDLNDK